MSKKQFFPMSIVDETVYIMEGAVRTSLTGTFILTLEGEVCVTTVREALDASCNLYPKFKCILVQNYPSIKRWFRYCWEYKDAKCENILKEIEDINQNYNPQEVFTYCKQNHLFTFLDITRQVPIQVVLIRQPDQATLIFTFHHAAVDGIGVILFIQRFIQFYEEIFYHRKKDNDYSPDFRAISQPEIKFPWKSFSLHHFYNYLRGAALLALEPSAQVQTQGGKGSMRMLLATVREITTSQLKTIRATVKKYHVTFNDYLLSAMFQTIKKWNQQGGKKSERIYINVPVNLRSPEDHTVGNILSGFNISFRSELIGEKREMVRLIRKELISMMENDIVRTTLSLTWILKLIPLKIKMLMFKHHPHTFYPTLALSNIGICNPNPSHKDEEGFHYMGAARISNISFITSAVPWPQVVVLTYNERMTICLSVFRSHFSLEAAERLLDSFVRELIE